MKRAERVQTVFTVARLMDSWHPEEAADFLTLYGVTWSRDTLTEFEPGAFVRRSLANPDIPDETILEIREYFELNGDLRPIDAANGSELDEIWEPIPVEVVETDFASAEVAVDEVIAEVRKNNGYASTHSEERDTILATLEAGKSTLSDRKVTPGMLRESLIKPLNYLVRKFGDSLIGVLAKKAAEIVLGL